ncbi:MAG: phosphatase PAP2 family protein [Myxococcota bacterium]
MVGKHAKFEPVVAPLYVYALLLALMPVCALMDLTVAPSIDWISLKSVPITSAIYIGYLVLMARYYGAFAASPRWAQILRIIAELALLYTLMSNVLPLFDQMTKIYALPLADDWLSAADIWLGFDWLAYFEFVHENQALSRVLDFAYMRTGELSLILVVILLVTLQFRRVQYHMECAFWVTFMSIIISIATPAYAAAIYYGINFLDYPNFGYAPGIYHIESLVLLREASPDYLVGAEPFRGLVTFPSIHTALGLVMVGAVWRHWLFWPYVAYAAIMIPSTPVFGSHYIIDIFAGAALTLAVLWLVARRSCYDGMFATPDRRPEAVPQAS